MLSVLADCGRSPKWCSRGRFAPGFKPRHGSHVGLTTQFWGRFWGSLYHSLGSRTDNARLGMGTIRDFAGRKRVKGLSLVDHEKVPRGLGLRTRDCKDTTDGAGNLWRPANGAQITGKNQELAEPQTSIFFPWDKVPLTGLTGQRWEGRTMCVCGCFKELWVFNGDILPLL